MWYLTEDMKSKIAHHRHILCLKNVVGKNSNFMGKFLFSCGGTSALGLSKSHSVDKDAPSECYWMPIYRYILQCYYVSLASSTYTLPPFTKGLQREQLLPSPLHVQCAKFFKYFSTTNTTVWDLEVFCLLLEVDTRVLFLPIDTI